MTRLPRIPPPAVFPALAVFVVAAAAPPRGTTEREAQIAHEVEAELDSAVKLRKDPHTADRLEAICAHLAARTARPLVEYRVKVIEAPVANAFIIPGGVIYVTSSLLDEVRSEHELAGVLAHEIAHNVAQHSIRRMDRGTTRALRLAELLSLGIFIATGGGEWGQAAQLGMGALTQSIMSGYSIEDEKEADLLGIGFMVGTEYDPVGFLAFLEQEATLRNQFLEESMGFFRTHPFSGDRVIRARRFLEERGIPIRRRLVNGAPEPHYGRVRDEAGAEMPAVVYEEEALYFLADADSTAAVLERNLSALSWMMDHELSAEDLWVEELPAGGAGLRADDASVELSPEDARANGVDALELAANLRDRLEAVRERDSRQVAVLYYLIGGMREE